MKNAKKNPVATASSESFIRRRGQIEAGAAHSIETTGGRLPVCQNSLQKFLQKGE